MLARQDGTCSITKLLVKGEWLGEVTQHGVDQGKMMFVDMDERGGYTTKHVSHGTEQDDGEQFATIHEAGHSYWSGIGMPAAYARAQLHVVRVISWEGPDFIVEPLFTMPAKAPRFVPTGIARTEAS